MYENFKNGILPAEEFYDYVEKHGLVKQLQAQLISDFWDIWSEKTKKYDD